MIQTVMETSQFPYKEGEMVTWNFQNSIPFGGGGPIYKEGVCMSNDIKPIDVANGSKLIEMDTSTLYVFDQDSEEWRAWG